MEPRGRLHAENGGGITALFLAPSQPWATGGIETDRQMRLSHHHPFIRYCQTERKPLRSCCLVPSRHPHSVN